MGTDRSSLHAVVVGLSQLSCVSRAAFPGLYSALGALGASRGVRSGEPKHQFVEGHGEAIGQAPGQGDADLALATLDEADLGSMHIRGLG